MKHKVLLMIAYLFGMLLLQSCESDSDDDLLVSSSVKQIDMTVVIPIDPSSLEYFDYVVRYSDNNGLEQVDTVSKAKGGISSDGWENAEIKNSFANTRGTIDYRNCFMKTFSYTLLPVSSRASVELVPKCPKDSVVSFSFIIPKPYLFPNVYFSGSSIPEDSTNRTLDGIDVIRIDSMSIGSFLSIYGTTFSSCCQVTEGNGIDINFY